MLRVRNRTISNAKHFGWFMLWHQHKKKRSEHGGNSKQKRQIIRVDLKKLSERDLHRTHEAGNWTFSNGAEKSGAQIRKNHFHRKKREEEQKHIFIFCVCLFEWKTGKSSTNNKFVMIPPWLYRFFTRLFRSTTKGRVLDEKIYLRVSLPRQQTSRWLLWFGPGEMMLSNVSEKKAEKIFSTSSHTNELLIRIVSLLIFVFLPGMYESLRMCRVRSRSFRMEFETKRKFSRINCSRIYHGVSMDHRVE